MATNKPTKRPQDFCFCTTDSHLIVNDVVETCKAYNYDGDLLWEVPCLARGQYSETTWNITNSDTPPGLYRIGTIYRDYDVYGNSPDFNRTLMSFGWCSFDLVELENQERKHGRAGIMLHGGGSGNGWPGAWAPRQKLLRTHGCIRMYNEDLQKKVLPLTDKGTVYVSVYQEAQ